MGITGLLPLLKSISKPRHVSHYSQQRVGIDGYAWLHRASTACAKELSQQQATDQHINWCLKRLSLLLRYQIRPLLVFDGLDLPQKLCTQEVRQEKRSKELTLATELSEQGLMDAATKAYQRSINITPYYAKALQLACQEQFPHRIEFLHSPYEADAELAYLSSINYITAIISEDSDLLVYNCNRVLYKMDSQGQGQEIEISNLSQCTELNFANFNHDQFQEMIVFAGCDYLPSLNGLGLKKAHALMRNCKNWKRVIRKIRLEGKAEVPDDYEIQYEKALLCFRHQTVYDPKKCHQLHLTPIPEVILSKYSDLSFLGAVQNDASLAMRVAIGELHPDTLQAYDTQLLQLHHNAYDARKQAKNHRITADANISSLNAQTITSSVSSTKDIANVWSRNTYKSQFIANYPKIVSMLTPLSQSQAVQQPFTAPRSFANKSSTDANSHNRQAPRVKNNAHISSPSLKRRKACLLDDESYFFPPDSFQERKCDTDEAEELQVFDEDKLSQEEKIVLSANLTAEAIEESDICVHMLLERDNFEVVKLKQQPNDDTHEGDHKDYDDCLESNVRQHQAKTSYREEMRTNESKKMILKCKRMSSKRDKSLRLLAA